MKADLYRCNNCNTEYNWDSESAACGVCHRHNVQYSYPQGLFCFDCKMWVPRTWTCPKCCSEHCTQIPNSLCFLTSACVEAKGLSDDCEELQLLRKYRDILSKEDSEFAEQVKDYYQNAPKIVEAINALQDRLEQYESIYNNLVIPTVRMLKQGTIKDAAKYYLTYYRVLKAQYLSDSIV